MPIFFIIVIQCLDHDYFIFGIITKLHTSAFQRTSLQHLQALFLYMSSPCARTVIVCLCRFWSCPQQLLILISALVLQLSYLYPVLPIIETVVDNPELWKFEFSQIIHREDAPTHFKIGVVSVYWLICFKSHICYSWFMYKCLCICIFTFSIINIDMYNDCILMFLK